MRSGATSGPGNLAQRDLGQQPGECEGNQGERRRHRAQRRGVGQQISVVDSWRQLTQRRRIGPHRRGRRAGGQGSWRQVAGQLGDQPIAEDGTEDGGAERRPDRSEKVTPEVATPRSR